MAGPQQRRRSATQTAQELQQQRMLQADSILRQNLMQNGYNRQQADEILRLAHQMYRPGNQAPPRVVLAPTGIQSTIRRDDLIKARDYLMTVARLPRVPVQDIMAGTTRNPETGMQEPIRYTVRDRNGRRRTETYEPPLFGGPEGRGPVVRMAQAPAPVRIYNYSVYLTDARGRQSEYEISLNRSLPRGSGMIDALRAALYDTENPSVIAVTQNGQAINQDQFRTTYSSVWMDARGTGTQASIEIHASRARRGT